MTYFSQFPQSRVQSQGKLINVEENPIVERESEFYINLSHFDLHPNVEIFDLYGDLIPTKIEQDSAISSHFLVSYMPEHVGIHKVLF